MEMTFRLVLMALIGAVGAYRLAVWRFAERQAAANGQPSGNRSKSGPDEVLAGTLR